jgi:autotransporter translocation and assembly factor TamB
LTLQGAARRGVGSLSKLDLATNIDGTRLRFNARGKGRFSKSFDGTAAGYVQRIGAKVDGALERFSGQFAGAPFALTEPARFQRTSNVWSLEPVSLRTAGGTARGSVALGPDRQKVMLRFSGVQLERLPIPMMDKAQGKAQGEVSLQGTGGVAQGELAFGIEGLRFRGTSLADLPPAALSARGTLQADGLHVSLSLRGPTDRPVAGELELPMRLTLMPFRWALPRDGALRGHLEGIVPLEQLVELAGVDDQELKGQLDGRFELAGTLNSPTVRGRAQIKDGRYENFRSGTLLESLNLTVRGTPVGLAIEEAAASDGAGGKITAGGALEFSSAGGRRLNLDVKVAQANLLRHDYADATVSGDLTLRGTLKQPLLAGRLEVGPAEFRIPERLPTGTSELEVVKVGAEAVQTDAPKPRKPATTTKLEMDVGLTIPGRVFLRGKGLDSEWKGNLTVGGNAAKPILTGGLSVVRGHFDLLGKRFRIRDGRIDFAGQSPPEPTIDVRAEAKTPELTARLQLTGFARAPQIVLSSDPALPRDEVLSHLLFGRSRQKITPLQAVRLGQAAAALTGGGGLDPLGRARTLMGVDRLDVKQQDDDPNAVAVSAGKHLSDKVYVEVERGATEESGKVSMELELTPNLSVETEVGTNAQGGVGLNWRWDY